MIGIVVFFNSVYKHGLCKHWQYKKLSNLFQYWKIRCVQLSSFSLSGGYMGTCPFQSLSIKSPVQRKKKGIQKYWNVMSEDDESDFFLPEKGRSPQRAPFHWRIHSLISSKPPSNFCRVNWQWSLVQSSTRQALKVTVVQQQLCLS